MLGDGRKADRGLAVIFAVKSLSGFNCTFSGGEFGRELSEFGGSIRVRQHHCRLSILVRIGKRPNVSVHQRYFPANLVSLPLVLPDAAFSGPVRRSSEWACSLVPF